MCVACATASLRFDTCVISHVDLVRGSLPQALVDAADSDPYVSDYVKRFCGPELTLASYDNQYIGLEALAVFGAGQLLHDLLVGLRRSREGLGVPKWVDVVLGRMRDPSPHRRLSLSECEVLLAGIDADSACLVCGAKGTSPVAYGGVTAAVGPQPPSVDVVGGSGTAVSEDSESAMSASALEAKRAAEVEAEAEAEVDADADAED